jgi:hypothetical protein
VDRVHRPTVYGCTMFIKAQPSVPRWVAKIKTAERVSLDLITIVGDMMDDSGFTEVAVAGRLGHMAVPWPSTAVHRSGG